MPENDNDVVTILWDQFADSLSRFFTVDECEERTAEFATAEWVLCVER